jgi:hypothetical protein
MGASAPLYPFSHPFQDIKFVPYFIPPRRIRYDPWHDHDEEDMYDLSTLLNILEIDRVNELVRDLSLDEYISLCQVVSLDLFTWIGRGPDDYYRRFAEQFGLSSLLRKALLKAAHTFVEERNKAHAQKAKPLSSSEIGNRLNFSQSNTNEILKGVLANVSAR